MMKGQLSSLPTFVACLIGSLLGISVSYLLGWYSKESLTHTLGPWIGLTARRIQLIKTWFGQWGKLTLVFGYFVPGIRHLTGYVAGLTQLNYKLFALYAYLGAGLWVTLFLAIGYFLGPTAEQFIHTLDKSLGILVGAGIILLALVMVIRKTCKKSREQ